MQGDNRFDWSVLSNKKFSDSSCPILVGMKSYLDKYKGSVDKNVSDFDMGEIKKKKKSSTIKQIESDEVAEFGDLAPVIVNNDAHEKLVADKERIKYLNSVKKASDAGWKTIDDEVKPDGTQSKIRQRHDSPEPIEHISIAKGDLSPPRRRPVSPPRRNQSDRDLSPPRRRPRNDSPERSRDLSPPRRDPMVGLVSSKNLTDSLDAKQEMEKAQFNRMNPTMTGQNASTVFRDKDGKKISEEEYIEMKKKEREKKKDYVIQTEFEWGTGLVQKRQQMTEEEQIAQEMSKPFARYEGKDDDIEEELKRIQREGDPMEKFLKKKKKTKKNLDFPPNRYMIAPGKKWDGIDRSNGYEKTYLQNLNKKRMEDKREYQDF
jgi:hypothetical protein